LKTKHWSERQRERTDRTRSKSPFTLICVIGFRGAHWSVGLDWIFSELSNFRSLQRDTRSSQIQSGCRQISRPITGSEIWRQHYLSSPQPGCNMITAASPRHCLAKSNQ